MEWNIIKKIRLYLFNRRMQVYRAKEVEEYCRFIFSKIEEDDLSNMTISCYLRHLPIRGLSGKWKWWPEKTLSLTDKCVQAMYEYSIRKGFIDSTVSKEEFVQDFWDIQVAKKRRKQ